VERVGGAQPELIGGGQGGDEELRAEIGLGVEGPVAVAGARRGRREAAGRGVQQIDDRAGDRCGS
jgi:hypothetical protein